MKKEREIEREIILYIILSCRLPLCCLLLSNAELMLWAVIRKEWKEAYASVHKKADLITMRQYRK